MTEKMKHEISRRRGGQNESGWIQPHCSCGWVGNMHYAYNDYQHSNLNEEEDSHMRKARATIKACEGGK